MHPLLAQSGAGLWDCQNLEMGVTLLLASLAKDGEVGYDVDALLEILGSNKKKVTLGPLIRSLKKHAEMSEDLETAMTEALDARNEFIHRVLTENAELAQTEAGQLELVNKVSSLRKKIIRAIKLIQPFVDEFGKTLDPSIHTQVKMNINLTSKLLAGFSLSE